jgi:arsenate reductase
MSVTIYHNPGCSKSRQTLDLLRRNGVEPVIVDYLKTPPDAATLEAGDVGLDDPALTSDFLIDGMIANPIVIQRPIVLAGDQAALGRPPEDALAIL